MTPAGPPLHDSLGHFQRNVELKRPTLQSLVRRLFRYFSTDALKKSVGVRTVHQKPFPSDEYRATEAQNGHEAKISLSFVLEEECKSILVV